MGKNKKSEEEEEIKARAFVLKVAMHCSCDGCIDKIRAATRDITRLQGVETWDQSALESKGELMLVATADPDKLRQRLHKATRKQVDLLFPGNKEPIKNKDKAAAALLLDSAWANQLLAGGWNAHGGGYPWPAAQQQPDPYAACVSSGGSSSGPRRRLLRRCVARGPWLLMDGWMIETEMTPTPPHQLLL